MDRFTKACLVVIVLMLVLIYVRPMPASSAALAAKTPKYLAVRANLGEVYERGLQMTLDKYAAEGWEFVSPVSVGAQPGAVFLIFRK